MKIHKNGQTREATAEEESAIIAQQQADAATRADEEAALRVPEIKEAAGVVIVERYPEWKQRNMIARMVELNAKATPSAEEEAEMAALQSVWDWVKAVRAESDRLEADSNLTVNDANWPV